MAKVTYLTQTTQPRPADSMLLFGVLVVLVVYCWWTL